MANSIKCYACRDKGDLLPGCVSCGKVLEAEVAENEIENMNVFSFVEPKLDSKFPVIPQQYSNVIWDGSILMKHKSDKATRTLGIGNSDDLNFIRYVNNLESLRNIFVSSRIPAVSGFIIAPPGFSKITFAYDCMKIAKANGYTVAPLLDTGEAKLLCSLGVERPSYKLYGSITYEDYIMSDVLFLTVIKTYQREWAYEIIQQIIDTRSRKGLTTIILSRYKLSEISNRDRSNEFDPSVNASSPNKSKAITIIKYEET